MKPASRKNHYHYNKRLKEYARANRKSLTKSAACMWKYLLRAGTTKGFKFRRERPILNYIADFVCFELMLIIEVDGLSHQSEQQQRKDRIRDAKLNEIGFTVKRYSSWEVLNKMPNVSEDLCKWIEENYGK